MAKKSYIIPIFIPHMGCPHDCSFCNQKKIAKEITKITGEDVYKIIKQYIGFFPQNDVHKEIAFYGGSFTGLPMETQIELLTPAFETKTKGLVDGIRLSTRPDYIDRDILNLLDEYEVSTIELGVQSTDDKVLELNNRGHTSKEVFSAVKLIREYDFKLGLQMMVGLLGDNETTIQKTAVDIISLNPDFLRIYPTIVIKDTYLETLYIRGEYQPFTVEETISICKGLLLTFKKSNIPVIRLGLQSNEDINYGKSLVAGPYHPAFREMVETEIYKGLIEEEINKININKSKNIIIYCHPTSVSKVAGYKQSNKKYLMEKYKLSKIIIKYDEKMQEDEIKVQRI